MDTIEELTEFEDLIDAAHVRRRVEDWVRRIAAVYDDIRDWLPDGWTAKVSRTVPMHESLMKRFGIAERDLPVLTLMQGGHAEVDVVPQYLWTIGDNGRIDFIRGEKYFVMIDKAEHFAPPKWRIAPSLDRLNTRDFDRAYLSVILE